MSDGDEFETTPATLSQRRQGIVCLGVPRECLVQTRMLLSSQGQRQISLGLGRELDALVHNPMLGNDPLQEAHAHHSLPCSTYGRCSTSFAVQDWRASIQTSPQAAWPRRGQRPSLVQGERRRGRYHWRAVLGWDEVPRGHQSYHMAWRLEAPLITASCQPLMHGFSLTPGT